MGRVMLSIDRGQLRRARRADRRLDRRRPTRALRRARAAQHARQPRARRRQARARPARHPGRAHASSPRCGSTPTAASRWNPALLHGPATRRAARRDGPAGRAVELPASARSEPRLRAAAGDGRPASRAAPAADDDLCRTATAEAVRGFENNALARPEGARTMPHRRSAVAATTSSRRVALVGHRPQGPDHPHRRQRGPAGGRHAVLPRRRFRRALQRAGHAARAGRRLYRHRHEARSRTRATSCSTVTADTCGRHDTSAGACSCESNTVRFGHDTQYLHACRENFVLEVAQARHGQARHRAQHQLLHERADRARRRAGHRRRRLASRATMSSCVAEMDVLCVISNCPQVNNPCNGFNPTPIRVLIWDPRGLRCSARSWSPTAARSPAGSSAPCAGWASPRSRSIPTPTASPGRCALADEAVRLGPAPAAESYLDIEAVIAACRATGAEAVHPGYGFLSENIGFAERLAAEGIAFIGPRPEHIARLRPEAHGARAGQRAAACRCCPAPACSTTLEEALRGGRAHRLSGDAEEHGRRRRHRHAALRRRGGAARGASPACSAPPRASFGDARVYLERFVAGRPPCRGADLRRRQGQRRRARRARLLAAAAQPEGDRGDPGARPLATRCARACTQAAIDLGAAVAYASAGTVEFIYDPTREDFYFLEVNTRLQVEHPVTEAVFGIDLVEWMIRQAAGEDVIAGAVPLDAAGRRHRGAALCRDPARRFPAERRACSPRSTFPTSARVDTWIETGTEVTPVLRSDAGQDHRRRRRPRRGDRQAARGAGCDRDRAASRPTSTICAPSRAPSCSPAATSRPPRCATSPFTPDASRCWRRARSRACRTARAASASGMSACRPAGPMDDALVPPRQPARRQCRRRPRRSS